MSRSRPTICLGLLVSLLLCYCSSASADIYRYKDERGVWHFTNIRSDKRYKLYIRSYSKKPLEYIKDFDGIIKQASKRFSVEPSLIKAVIRAESAFDHRAVSRKGAEGLMQLMPQTANAMDVEDTFNPEENIFGGTRYLSLMLERFRNDIRLAVAAYNAGPESVEAYKGVPPFPETKSFVEKVLRFYKQYNTGVK
ncbi:MAG: lytic transglycosylase domain-containing protein [Desulfobacterales bacterium]|nr:lytic transglycosylase domain-containing protein [Desulfobacterales bacterium]